MHRRKIEDYVKTIYVMQRSRKVRGAYIAEQLHVSRPTVSISLKRMEHEGYLSMQPDHSVVLTEKGLEIAKEIIERNNAFYYLLINLGVDETTAAEDACHMEHAISQKSFLALSSLAECRLNGNKSVNASGD